MMRCEDKQFETIFVHVTKVIIVIKLSNLFYSLIISSCEIYSFFLYLYGKVQL